MECPVRFLDGPAWARWGSEILAKALHPALIPGFIDLIPMLGIKMEGPVGLSITVQRKQSERRPGRQTPLPVNV